MKRFLCWVCLVTMLFSVPNLVLAESEPARVLDITSRREVKGLAVDALIEEIRSGDYTRVEMMGVHVNANDRAKLVEALPEVDFHWMVTFASLQIDSDETHVNLDKSKNPIGSQRIINGLAQMHHVEEVTMYNSRLNLKDMERIFATYPEIDFHWSLRLDRYIIRNDSTAFSTAKGRQDPRYTAKQLMVLTHIPGLLALDFGHNNVSDLTFLENWPALRRLIVIDSKVPVTDISPLAKLMDLEYVELFMQDITDLTPLANHTKLLDLNLCHNNITDLTPLYSCTNLERLWISYNPNLSMEEIEAFQQAVPGCQVEYTEYQSTGAGWREHPRYFIMKESFDTRTYIPFE